MPKLYKIEYLEVTDLTKEEAEAIYKHSHVLNDHFELIPNIPFEPVNNDETEILEEFKKMVRPHVFKILKQMYEDGDSFIIC